MHVFAGQPAFMRVLWQHWSTREHPKIYTPMPFELASLGAGKGVVRITPNNDGYLEAQRHLEQFQGTL